jgi:hypothetical protein
MKKMKIFLILVGSLSVVFLLLQSFIAMPVNKTEQQKYSVIKTFKDFEVRFYPASTIATINSEAKNYRELSGSGFRKLAGYIFGGNEENKKIAMTSPVQMDINENQSSMSFVMPSDFSKDNLPKPNDSSIAIKTTEDEYVAVIRFGGYASDNDIKTYSKILQGYLDENNIKAIGNFKLLGYNPPYQVINRRNEIVVKVEWKSEK